jgi:hypothetical protein
MSVICDSKLPNIVTEHVKVHVLIVIVMTMIVMVVFGCLYFTTK